MDNDDMLMFVILCALFNRGDSIFSQPPEYTDEDKALDEEYTKSGACERSVKENRYTLQYGGHPQIKKEGDEIRCRGYIYSMNQEVCDECLKCKIQYGHPFDPYWERKEDFIERCNLKLHHGLHDMNNDIYSYGYNCSKKEEN